MADNIQLYEGDCRDLMIMPDQRADLIFTDPPYQKKYLYLYEWLAENTQFMLRPGRMLLVYVAPTHKETVMKIFSVAGLTYFYDFILVHNGNTTILWPKKVISGYKSIMAYYYGEKPFLKTIVLGCFKGLGSDKRYHKWGQSEHEARYYIENYTKRGEYVLDPFMGAGTTGIVCKRLGRGFIGYEIEKDTFKIAEQRIMETETVEHIKQLELNYVKSE